MGDRRPFSFRFWQSGSPPNSRTPPARTTTTRSAPRTSAARPATTTSAAVPSPPTDGTQASGPSNSTTITPTSTTPPAAVTETPATKSTTTTTPPNPTPAPAPTPPAPTPTPTPIPTTQPEPKTQMAEQPPANAPTMTTPPPSDLQNAGQPTATAARPINGRQKKSPSRATTQSPSSSPSRSTTQSRSPPRAAPQARSTPSSPSRTGSQSPTTPQRTSQVRSPSRLTTRSTKQTSPRSTDASQSTFPSKESTQDVSNSDKPPTFASNENKPKPETSQQQPQEPQLLADGQTVPEKKITENQMEVTSPKLSEIGATTSPVKDSQAPALAQRFVSSTINAEHNPHNESIKKPEETKEVKEVMQATNTTTNMDENHLLTPKSGSGAQTTHTAETPSKPDQIQMEKKQAIDTKEISPASLPDIIIPSNATVSKPRNSSVSSNTRAQSALASGRHVPLSKDIRDDISKLINQTNARDPRSKDDRSVSVITLAGENRGASMQMGSNVSKTEGPIHIHRGYKIKRDESAQVTIDGVESSKGNKLEDAKSPGDEQRVSYINNNIQGINNSIVFNSSIAKRDPGVHMVISRVPNEPTETTGRRRPFETWKAEVSTIQANKLTYEPKVRRRCIRDLYLEPGDSDPENPQMP